jgi:hypothetical protein
MKALRSFQYESLVEKRGELLETHIVGNQQPSEMKTIHFEGSETIHLLE